MSENKSNALLIMLIGIDVLLIIAVSGLFIQVSRLQQSIASLTGPMAEGLEIASKAPPFTLQDTSGNNISLSDFAGEQVLLIFSSTTCPYCAELYPHLKTFSDEQQTIKVVMISHGSAEENQLLVKTQGFNFPVLTLDGSIAQDYQVPGTPFLYLIDANGIIANVGYASTLDQLKEFVSDFQE